MMMVKKDVNLENLCGIRTKIGPPPPPLYVGQECFQQCDDLDINDFYDMKRVIDMLSQLNRPFIYSRPDKQMINTMVHCHPGQIAGCL